MAPFVAALIVALHALGSQARSSPQMVKGEGDNMIVYEYGDWVQQWDDSTEDNSPEKCKPKFCAYFCAKKDQVGLCNRKKCICREGYGTTIPGNLKTNSAPVLQYPKFTYPPFKYPEFTFPPLSILFSYPTSTFPAGRARSNSEESAQDEENGRDLDQTTTDTRTETASGANENRKKHKGTTPEDSSDSSDSSKSDEDSDDDELTSTSDSVSVSIGLSTSAGKGHKRSKPKHAEEHTQDKGTTRDQESSTLDAEDATLNDK